MAGHCLWPPMASSGLGQRFVCMTFAVHANKCRMEANFHNFASAAYDGSKKKRKEKKRKEKKRKEKKRKEKKREEKKREEKKREEKKRKEEKRREKKRKEKKRLCLSASI